MSDINWNALFPGMDEQPKSGSRQLLDFFRGVRHSFEIEGATPEEATLLARMIAEPIMVEAYMRSQRGAE